MADLSARYGVVLDEWQELVLQAAMGERTDGKWATSQVAVSAPRQQGKSQLIVARALAGVLLFGERTIIISAHQQDTAREVFTRLVEILEDYPSLDARVESYGKALNREYIRFISGQVIRFKARSTGGGRGFSCDCLLLDEAQILSPAAWRAILPTMSARPNPQVWLLGTPPTPQDDGEVFGRFRQAGIEGKESRLAYLEWSAEPGDDLDDPAVWAKANPSFGSRISHDAIADERASMSDADFALERLGMWNDGGPAEDQWAVITELSWSDRAVPMSPDEGRRAYALDMSADRSTLAISVAVKPAVGPVHVECVLLEPSSRRMSDGRTAQDHAVDWLVAHWPESTAVLVDHYSNAMTLVPALRARHVKVTVTDTAGDMSRACGLFVDAVRDGTLTHFAQKPLDDAVAGARKRDYGTAGGWGWDRKNSTADLTPLISCTLALYGVLTSKRSPGRKSQVLVLS